MIEGDLSIPLAAAADRRVLRCYEMALAPESVLDARSTHAEFVRRYLSHPQTLIMDYSTGWIDRLLRKPSPQLYFYSADLVDSLLDKIVLGSELLFFCPASINECVDFYATQGFCITGDSLSVQDIPLSETQRADVAKLAAMLGDDQTIIFYCHDGYPVYVLPALLAR